MSVLDGAKFQGPFGMDQMSYGQFEQKPKVLPGSSLYLLLVLAKYAALDKFLDLMIAIFL